MCRHCASHANSFKCVLDDDDAAKAAAAASTTDGGALSIDDAACSPHRDTAGNKKAHTSNKPDEVTIIDDDNSKAEKRCVAYSVIRHTDRVQGTRGECKNESHALLAASYAYDRTAHIAEAASGRVRRCRREALEGAAHATVGPVGHVQTAR
jgi:hypothetical protein